MTRSPNQKNNLTFGKQANAQLLWTALVALALGWVALDHTATPNSIFWSATRTPDSFIYGSPLSGLNLLRPSEDRLPSSLR
ncbi:hypothetical protein WDW37_06985 [Bdellovibrionota bacterium FG-1]